MFIKICGVTNSADAQTAIRAGASALGLNFYPESPRSVSLEQGVEIVGKVPPFSTVVGVFVDPSSSQVRNCAQALGLTIVQLHGSFTPELVADLREYSLITAFALRDRGSLDQISSFLERCERLNTRPFAVLVDAHKEGMHGGTGNTAPWELARELTHICPVRIILAGGLRAKNVATAISAVRPWGVDVASGVEVAPGRKESYKVQQFIQNATKAARSLR